MLAAAVALVLAQAPHPVTLMEGGWVASGVEERQLTVWSELLFSELIEQGIVVKTQADVGQALGMEREKQLLGCGDDDSSCSAEIAEALNADGIIRGSVGQSGSSYVLNVRVLSPGGEPLAVKSAVVKSVEEVPAQLKPVARALAQALATRFPGRVVVKPAAANELAVKQSGRSPGPARFWWAPAAAAVVAAGVGAGLQVAARGIDTDVRTNPGNYATLADAQKAIANGQGLETGSFVAFGVAGAAVVGTVVLLWLGGDRQDGPPVALVPTLTGAALVGRWP